MSNFTFNFNFNFKSFSISNFKSNTKLSRFELKNATFNLDVAFHVPNRIRETQ